MIIKINESIALDVDFLKDGNVIYNRCIIENNTSIHKLKVQISTVIKNGKLIEVFVKDNFNINVVVSLFSETDIRITKVTEVKYDNIILLNR